MKIKWLHIDISFRKEVIMVIFKLYLSSIQDREIDNMCANNKYRYEQILEMVYQWIVMGKTIKLLWLTIMIKPYHKCDYGI